MIIIERFERGDEIGAGDAQLRGALGETPNLAARLQALAEPNGIVICDATPATDKPTDPGRVAARPIEALDEARRDRVDTADEDNWNGSGR